MPNHQKKQTRPTAGCVLGADTFAAISAVEGLTLTPDARERLAAAKSAMLSGAERRELVRNAYRGAKART